MHNPCSGHKQPLEIHDNHVTKLKLTRWGGFSPNKDPHRTKRLAKQELYKQLKKSSKFTINEETKYSQPVNQRGILGYSKYIWNSPSVHKGVYPQTDNQPTPLFHNRPVISNMKNKYKPRTN